MKISTIPGTLSLVALALIASPYARAQDTGWYLGLNVGQARAKIDDARITSGLLGSGLGVTTLQDHDKDLGFKVFGGYEFNRWFSLEGGYFNLGKMGYDATTLPAGTLNGQIKVQGVNLDAVLKVPLTEKFSVFGRAGVIYADAKDTFSGTGAVIVVNPSPSEKATNYKYGGGLQYDFTKSFGMRAEYERYRINDAVSNKGDLDLASIGLLFRFGRTAPAVAKYTPPPPEPVVYTPPPYVAPVPVIVPVVVRTQKYCTILDLTFEINTEAIERDDLEKLGVIGTFLTKYPETTVVIEGHTDNVGTEEHNLKLSKERAESVVNYLVDTKHVDRSRLSAVGYGWTRPVADNSTEDGKRQNRRIDAVVACVTDIEGLKVAPPRITMAMEVEFDPKSDEVKPEHRDDLARVANFLKANPAVTATVEGHTGNLQKNPAEAMKISQRRAENVVTYLVDNFGIARSRLSAEGFGGTRHFAYNTTAEGRQENRRVNIIINYPKKR